jgi:eukaryotic-like serine/threonine-protein kinase
MAGRAAQSPPALPGFTHVELLGSGGFADVFLYEQHLPRRRVAVKVLLTERMASGSIEEFTAEANVMALLSTHPAIVTIHQAGLAADGRPYLVMEYCPKPNLQVRFRREPFSVAEALRVGVQVAAAVETAHRAGVLHRDIKPANILVTEYNRPALTDFGIASTTGAGEAGGLSIPWSPPEAVAAAVPSGDARWDVWSLGATVYSLLAGRSPFELPGHRNSAADLIERIPTMPLPPLARTDAPVSLQRALERAMAKAPADRYDSALAFARALQRVQIELAHSVTPIDILDEGAPDGVVDHEDDGLTRVRGVVSIDPVAPAATATDDAALWAPDAATRRWAARPLDAAYAADDDATRNRAPVEVPPVEVSPSVRAAASGWAPGEPGYTPTSYDIGPAAPLAAPTPVAPARSRRGLWFGVGAGAFVLVVAAVLAIALPAVLGPGAPVQESAAPTDAPVDVLPASAPVPRDLAGAEVGDGVVEFTWTNPDPLPGDEYLYGVVVAGGGEPALERVSETSVSVPLDVSGTTCIQVLTRRANGQSSQPATACTP